MENKKITPRAMTFAELEKFSDYADELNSEKLTPTKTALRLAKWTAKEVYGIDAETSKLPAGTFIDLLTKTRQLTDKSEVEDLKNLKESGNGE